MKSPVRAVIAAVLVVVVAYLVVHWLTAARPVHVLAGLPVQCILDANGNPVAVGTYGNVWPLGASAKADGAGTHFDMPLIDSPALAGSLAVGGSSNGGMMVRDLSVPGGGGWDRPFDAPLTAPPGVAGNLAVVAYGRGGLTGVNLLTGATAWHRRLQSVVRMRPLAWHGYWVVVDRNQRLWFLPQHGQAIDYLDLGGHIVGVGCDRDWLWVALSDGRVAAWSAPARGNFCKTGIVPGRLQVGAGLAAVASGGGKLVGLTSGGGLPRVLWHRTIYGVITALAGPFSYRDREVWAVGATTADVYLFDATTGRRVQDVRLGDSPVTSIDVIGGQVFAGSSEGAWRWPLPR